MTLTVRRWLSAWCVPAAREAVCLHEHRDDHTQDKLTEQKRAAIQSSHEQATLLVLAGNTMSTSMMCAHGCGE